MNKIFIALKETETKTNQCEGLIYRGTVNVFIGSDGSINKKASAKLIKRRSCPGCSKCYSIIDMISEFMGNCEYDFGLSDIEDGKLYQLSVTNIDTDWESGIVDSWDLEFIECK